MNIFKRIVALFKRSPVYDGPKAPECYNLKVRIIANAGYSFDEQMQGKIYPARLVGKHYDVWAPAIAHSIPKGGHFNLEHVAGGSGRDKPYWCFTPKHLEVLK